MDRHSGKLGTLGAAFLVAVLACSSPSPSNETPETLSTTASRSSTTPSTSTTVAGPDPTSPETTTSSTTVPPEVALVVGDFGTGGSHEADVAEAMEEAATDGAANWLVTTGDNFYVDDVESAWSGPFGWVADTGIDVLAALGNHDVETANRRELVTEELGIENDWYRTEVGDAVVLVLSGNRVGDEAQLEWLQANLERAEDEMVVAVFHQPAFSCSAHGSTTAVVDRWVPLFEKHDVDLVLNGHDHNYQRHERSGVTYVVTGGGGAGLYAIEDCPEGTDPPLVANDTDHHFLVMSIGTQSLDVEARSVEGVVLDSFTIEP